MEESKSTIQPIKEAPNLNRLANKLSLKTEEHTLQQIEYISKRNKLSDCQENTNKSCNPIASSLEKCNLENSKMAFGFDYCPYDSIESSERSNYFIDKDSENCDF
jgi:hypothetical protein